MAESVFIDSGSGLYDFRARVWSPELAAFLQPDEYGFLTRSGTLWSWPGQNPFRYADPTGRDAIGRWIGSAVGEILGGGIGGALGAVAGGAATVETGPGAIAGAGVGAVEGGAVGADVGALAGGELGDALGDALKGLIARATSSDPKECKAQGQTPAGLGLSDKINKQMPKRGWTPEQIDEAVQSGDQIPATNKANGNPATRYVNPETGQSVVVDDVAGEVIHVGGSGFDYGPESGDLP